MADPHLVVSIGSSIDRSEALNREFAGRPDELNFTLDEVTEKMANFERAAIPTI